MHMSTRTFNSLPALESRPVLPPASDAGRQSSLRSARLATINEALLVGIALATIALLSGGKPTDWMGAAAVFITFLHGQLSFDMQESQGKMPEASANRVENYHWSGRLFVTKEILWIATFMMTGSWPLCAGSVIFATYPHWRAYLRR